MRYWYIMRARPKSYRISRVFRSAAHRTPPTARRDIWSRSIRHRNGYIICVLYTCRSHCHPIQTRLSEPSSTSPPMEYRKPTHVPVQVSHVGVESSLYCVHKPLVNKNGVHSIARLFILFSILRYF